MRRHPEIQERRRIHDDIEQALVDLDVDGLRFVLCVALLRGMDKAELDAVHERMKGVVLEGSRS